MVLCASSFVLMSSPGIESLSCQSRMQERSSSNVSASMTRSSSVAAPDTCCVVRDDGTLCGLLLRDELVHFDADAPLGAIMDRSPVVVHSGWPLSRAHRLFAALGLRHLVVVDPRAGGTPVGIVRRVHSLLLGRNATHEP